jgi:predicted nucleic acid-binding Zn ribbon protein
MELLGEILRRYFHDIGIESSIRQYEALSVWPSVVGSAIASVTEPKHISSGTLFVKVKSASWRNELVFHKPSLIDRLNQRLGSRTIRDIVLL